MATIEIDGKTVEIQPGQMLIEVADTEQIHVPRFCYHNKLSIAANCRMCLVEVENAPKPVPACATPVSDGMVVKTKSPRAVAAQRSVMEFLLINHPLDCPICDQGGECELQDVAMGYGGDLSTFSEGKRVVEDKDIGPLIQTDMTRCIHCTRCVRFGEEVAGLRELGATGRGEHTQIGLFLEGSMDSNLSGNVIDLCPVGALTSKPFRFKARAWEMNQAASVAYHDCVGSNIYAHVRRDEVMRIVPRENEEINEAWLSDRDRFSYEAYQSPERLLAPEIKENGQWKTVSWEAALIRVAEKMANIPSDAWGALLSPNVAMEEAYLLQGIFRAKGTNNIDHRLRQSDFRDDANAPVFPGLGLSLEALETCDRIVLIGADVNEEQPIMAHRLRKTAGAGGEILLINPMDVDCLFDLHDKLIAKSGHMHNDLLDLLAAQAQLSTATEVPAELGKLLSARNPTEQHQQLAQWLASGEKVAVIVGALAQQNAQSAGLRHLAHAIADLAGGTSGLLTEGANSAGAWIAGAVPHRAPAGNVSDQVGLNAKQMIDAPLKAYWALQVEPELDCAHGLQAARAMEQADWVVQFSSFVTEAMRDYADVLLPVAPPLESCGTFVNAQGDWQSFKPVVNPQGESKPAWKIFRVLGNLMNVAGFEYSRVEAVTQEIRQHFEQASESANTAPVDWTIVQGKTPEGVVRIAPVPAYASDNIVRRAPALQATTTMTDVACARMHPEQAKMLDLVDAKTIQITQDLHSPGGKLPLVLDMKIPMGVVCIPMALSQTVMLGSSTEQVELRK